RAIRAMCEPTGQTQCRRREPMNAIACASETEPTQMPSDGCHCLDADGIGGDGELLTAQGAPRRHIDVAKCVPKKRVLKLQERRLELKKPLRKVRPVHLAEARQAWIGESW